MKKTSRPSSRKTRPSKNSFQLLSGFLFKRKPVFLFVILFAVVGTITLLRILANPYYGLPETVLSNPALPDGVAPLGQGRIAENSGKSYLLYATRFTNEPWLRVDVGLSGEQSHIALPAGTTGGTAWARTDIAVSGTEVWVVSGAGPIYLRHYRMSGTPMPNKATLIQEHVLGDTDSRTGAITALASGKALLVWHQQGVSTPQALHFALVSPDSSIQKSSVGGLSTRSSTQAIAQHPVDGSVWTFSSSDAGSAIYSVRLTETSSGLSAGPAQALITEQLHGTNGPDPEAPDIEVAPDPTTGTIAIAYQSADRKIFSTQPFLAGSYPVVARLKTDATLSFLKLPVYVERISAIGLTVTGQETWLAYRPIAPDLSFNNLYISRHNGTSWESSALLGTLGDPRAMVYFARNITAFGAPMNDNLTHLFGFTKSSDSSNSGADTSPPSVTIQQPAAGSSVSGTVSIEATASDNTGVKRMELHIDGVLVSSSTSGTLSYRWSTNKVTKGSHNIIITAYDAAGNAGNDSIAVTIATTSGSPRKKN